jgi:hypothetical protein
MTSENLKALEQGFSKGLNVLQACLYAGISKSTYYDYCKDHPVFSDRIDQLRESTNMRAILNLSEAVESGSKEDSWKWVERRVKEFSPKQEVKSEGEFTHKVIDLTETPDDELSRIAAGGTS